MTPQCSTSRASGCTNRQGATRTERLSPSPPGLWLLLLSLSADRVLLREMTAGTVVVRTIKISITHWPRNDALDIASAVNVVHELEMLLAVRAAGEPVQLEHRNERHVSEKDLDVPARD